jgi:hypothetical protein
MDLKNLTPDQLKQVIGILESAVGSQAYDVHNFQDTKFEIRGDEKVTPGKFRNDPLIPGGYVAHPLTIRAMRKNILMAGNDLNETAIPYQCHQCSEDLDAQFWHFCPICGTLFDK